MLFEDVFRPGDTKSDFMGRVDEVAVDFRRQYGTGPVHQLGLAVADVEATADELESSGAGPFFIAEGDTATWRERGTERRYRGKLGIGYLHGMELELLEAGEGSDFYGRFVDPGGKPVLHHLAFVVDDVDFWRGKMDESGFPLWVDGIIKAGPMRVDFAYFDTLDPAGIIMEFETYRLFHFIQRRPPQFIYQALGRFQKISGVRSFRV